MMATTKKQKLLPTVFSQMRLAIKAFQKEKNKQVKKAMKP